MATFSQRIKEARLNRGLSQSDLARRLGISPTAVWNWEMGNTTPRPHNMISIAKALGVTTGYLEGGDVTPPQGVPVPTMSVEQVLDEAKEKIARVLGAPKEKVQLTFSMSG